MDKGPTPPHAHDKAGNNATGRLIYLIGPSGSGKDSVLEATRKIIDDLPQHNRPSVLFAHRYITRPFGARGENHVALSPQEFSVRQQHGLFLFNWHSHNLHYGIGIEVENWRQRGFDVVVNGSRAYLEAATRICPGLLPVVIRVNLKALKQRLEHRGRESAAEIEERLARASAFNVTHPRLIEIDNSGALSSAVKKFMAALNW